MISVILEARSRPVRRRIEKAPSFQARGPAGGCLINLDGRRGCICLNHSSEQQHRQPTMKSTYTTLWYIMLIGRMFVNASLLFDAQL